MNEYNFNFSEIFEIAEKIEINGAEFYHAAAKKFTDCHEIYKMLKKLENEEKCHENIFKKYKEYYSHGSSGNIDCLDELSLKYISSLADKYVFNKSINCLADDSTKANIFDFAIQREKDAILFYTAIKKTMIDNKDKDALEAIINEEQRHLTRLTDYKNNFQYLLEK